MIPATDRLPPPLNLWETLKDRAIPQLAERNRELRRSRAGYRADQVTLSPPAHGARPAQVRPQAEPGVTLTVLTQNTFGLPSPIGTDLKTRFGRMGPALSGYDFAGLQETFTGEAGRLLKDAGYSYGYWERKSGGLLGINSGLMTLSRHPIVGTRYQHYRFANDFDFLARKGITLTRVMVPGVGPVDVYNTHLQAQGYERIRVTQVEDLVKFIRKHDQGFPTLLLGDFNARTDSPSQRLMQQELGIRDTFGEANPGAPGYTDDGEGGQRIDYIFVLPNATWDIDVVASQVVNQDAQGHPTISDHRGVASTLRFRPKS